MQALRPPYRELPSPRWVPRRSRVGAPSSSARPPAWGRCWRGRSAPSGAVRRHGPAASAWPCAPGTSRVPRAGCCARRGASTCSACAGRTPRAGASRCACAARGGRWSPWVRARRPRRPRARHRHAASAPPIRSGPAAATSSSCALRGAPRGALRVHFVAVPAAGRRSPRARAAASPKQQAAPQPGTPPPIIPRAAWGADAVPPRSAPDYGVVQVAFVHHTVTANDYAPEQSAGDRARHRQVPPRLQRLERHRLQLPRRPVRAGLRGPRGRGRPGGHRRPGAGLQLAVRPASRCSAPSADVPIPEAGDGGDRAAARLEALAARRAVRGQV